MLIGRSRRCDLTIRSPLVSRRHCRLEKRDSGAFLRDLGSQNGTWIDGERIDHAFLQSGDRFVAGDVVLRLLPDGGVEEEGNSNPRHLRNAPKLKDQGPALALVLLPLLGVTALLVLSSLGGESNGGESGSGGDHRLADNSSGPVVAPNSIAGGAEVPDDSSIPPSEPGDSSPVTGTTESTDSAVNPAGETGADPLLADRATPPVSYSLEDLLSIARTCDSELAAREAEMAALLEDAGDSSSEPVRPPSLEDSWEGIAANAGGGTQPTFWSAPGDAKPANGPVLGSRSAPSRSPQTSASSDEYAEPAGPLFPEGARNDIALAIVDEGRGMIDRYHVREVSYTPLRPLITRLRDLDGIPAAHGLLSLREHTHEHLGRVYRRVRKLEREARKSGKELDKGSGGADAREDELTLRLAEMVKEHLETLVLIRDELESALAHEGRPVFIAEVLSAALSLKEPRLFLVGAKAAKEHGREAVVPGLIAGLRSGNVKIRRSARETLEHITGAKPGSSHRAWSEWYDLREGKESGS